MRVKPAPALVRLDDGRLNATLVNLSDLMLRWADVTAPTELIVINLIKANDLFRLGHQTSDLILVSHHHPPSTSLAV